MGISSPSEIPQSLAAVKQSSAARQQQCIYGIAQTIVAKFSIVEEALLLQSMPKRDDRVNNYAHVLCHFGSIALEFKDAWQEGDGDQICQCWKVFLLHFYQNRRTKYAWEALHLQLQIHSLPPQLSSVERVNKLFKEIIANMGSNMTEESIHRAAWSVTALKCVRILTSSQESLSVQLLTPLVRMIMMFSGFPLFW